MHLMDMEKHFITMEELKEQVDSLSLQEKQKTKYWTENWKILGECEKKRLEAESEEKRMEVERER